ncbi:MAG: hypothetical protein IPO90_03850 [Flavobacteriales bacterium]|nr:hypothetical protein [Flavobacteriales bacterium]MBL0046224.1 hypothetical protein [Flavobacteriales bacterium]
MRTIIRLVVFITAALLCEATFAQGGQQSWLVETMYKSGKINTVITIVTIFLAGLTAWMFLMDRKLRKLEQQQRSGRA